MDLPTTAFEFEEMFATEEACVSFLRKRRWAAGFVCPRCGGTKAWQLRTRALDECAACGHQVSLTAGTALAGTRKPLRLWFRVMGELLCSKRGCSALELTRRFPLSYGTAWTWLHKLRTCMDRKAGDPLSGTVEVDETYLGGHDDGTERGRSLAGKKMLVVGAAECRGEAIGRIRLRGIAAASASLLCGFIAETVHPGGSIRTDGLPQYKGIGSLEYEHTRLIVGNPKQASKLFPRVHRLFSLLDRWLLGTFHGSISRQHLQRYLDEFVFRFNRRNAARRPLLVERLTDSLFRSVPTYAQLVSPEPLFLVAP
jgi:transposase-like protein/Zn ribbon nucleic-acid-binding protein